MTFASLYRCWLPRLIRLRKDVIICGNSVVMTKPRLWVIDHPCPKEIELVTLRNETFRTTNLAEMPCIEEKLSSLFSVSVSKMVAMKHVMREARKKEKAARGLGGMKHSYAILRTFLQKRLSCVVDMFRDLRLFVSVAKTIVLT